MQGSRLLVHRSIHDKVVAELVRRAGEIRIGDPQSAETQMGPMVSARQRDLVERARDAGAMAYLVKPFTISDLIPAIEVALSRFSEVRALEREVETLSDRLETRKLVERAKGILQANQGMTEPEAFKWIQRAAMDRRTTMKHVAEVVLETLDTTKDASS